MATIINDPYARGAGGVTGERLGGAINSSLQRLAEQKMQHIEDAYQRKQQLRQMFENQQINQAMQQQQHQQLSQALASTGNFTPEQANVIAWQQLLNPQSAPRAMEGFFNTGEAGQPQQMAPQMPNTGLSALQARPQQQSVQQQPAQVPQSQMLAGLMSPKTPLLGRMSQSRALENMFEPGASEKLPIPQVGGEVPASAGLTPQQQRRVGWGGKVTGELTPAQQTSEQRRIDAGNKKFTEKLSKDYMNAIDARDAAQEALQLIDTGKTRSGLAGYAPLWGANPETRELNKIYEDLALTLASSSGGVLSRAKLSAARATKPSLDMPIEAQKYMLNRIIQKAEKEGIALGDIKDRLIEENGGKAPEGLEQKVLKEWKELNAQERTPVTQTQSPRQEPQENAVEYATRLAGGIGSRVASGVVTGLGDIAAAGLGGLNYLSGGKTPTYAELQGKLPISAPTSEDATKKISEWTKGYTDPKSSFESVLYDVADVFGSIFSPGKAAPAMLKLLGKTGLATGAATKATKVLLPFSGVKVPLKRALGMAAAGEAAGKTTEAFGGGPVEQTAARLITTVAAGYPGPRKAFEKQAATSYEEAAKAFANDKVDVKGLRSKLVNLEGKFKREAVPHKKELKEIMDSVQNGLSQSKDNMMSVNELINMKQGLNSRFGWTTFEKLQGDRTYLPKELRKPLGQIIEEIKQPILKAGEANPKGGKAFVIADDITKGLTKSSQATLWLKENSDLHHKTGHTMTSTLMRIATGAALKGPHAISRARDFFNAYPPAKQYYWNVLKAAAEENRGMFVKNLAKLDKVSKLYDSKND